MSKAVWKIESCFTLLNNNVINFNTTKTTKSFDFISFHSLPAARFVAGHVKLQLISSRRPLPYTSHTAADSVHSKNYYLSRA